MSEAATGDWGDPRHFLLWGRGLKTSFCAAGRFGFQSQPCHLQLLMGCLHPLSLFLHLLGGLSILPAHRLV